MEYSLGTGWESKATSAFPLAIGTSLAFESVFQGRQPPYDKDRVIPNSVDVRDYDSCWINLTTLFRNLVSSVNKDVFTAAKPGEIADALEEEIAVIEGLFSVEGMGVCKPFFYYSTYEELLHKKVPGLTFRTENTDQQKYYKYQLDSVLKILEKRTDSLHRFKDALAPMQRERSFVLTHQPYDLTGHSRFDRLDLLESNTGVLKPKALWNTKYYPISGQSLIHLPFHKKLLFVMGDKVLIKPMPHVFRQKILEIAEKRKWTSLTTLDAINLHMSLDVQDPYMIAVWKSL